MLEALGGALIAFGLLSSNSDKEWLSILGVILFIVGLIIMITKHVDDSKEEIKREILDEIEDSK